MAAPSSYTEDTFKAYLHVVLGDIGTALGWTVLAGNYDEPVNDALLLYDADTIAAATNIAKLRSAGKIAVWRAAANSLAARYDVKTGADSLSRSQMYKQAQKQQLAAEFAGMIYGLDYTVTTTTVTRSDFYSASDLEDEDYR